MRFHGRASSNGPVWAACILVLTACVPAYAQFDRSAPPAWAGQPGTAAGAAQPGAGPVIRTRPVWGTGEGLGTLMRGRAFGEEELERSGAARDLYGQETREEIATRLFGEDVFREALATSEQYSKGELDIDESEIPEVNTLEQYEEAVRSKRPLIRINDELYRFQDLTLRKYYPIGEPLRVANQITFQVLQPEIQAVIDQENRKSFPEFYSYQEWTRQQTQQVRR